MADPDVPHRGIAPPNDALSAVRVAFPQTEEDFEHDDRVSFSKVDNKWILEDVNGEWEWLAAHKKWIPSQDEALLEQQRSAYKMAGVDENAPAIENKKRKAEEKANGKPKKPKQEPTERKNTSVYVTGLPLDATMEEVYDVFKKFGIIADSIDTGRPRVRLYADDNGNFKGEALITYFKPESVPIAINMLDETDMRTGMSGSMRVQQASMDYKKQKEIPTGEAATKNKRNMRDRQKIIEKTQQMNARLADWDDDDPSIIAERVSKWDKNVTLKHMFTLKEIEEDPAAILEIKEDIREECSKFGEITNVVLYDLEPEGVITVRFTDPESARHAVRVLHGRHFDGQIVEAYIPSGKERFKKSAKKETGVEHDGFDDDDPEDAEQKRIEKFGDFLDADQKQDEPKKGEA